MFKKQLISYEENGKEIKKMKKIILMCLTLLLVSGCGNKNIQKPNIEEEPKKIESNATIQDFQFQLVEGKTENETTSFEFEITNVSSEPKYLKEFLVKVSLEDESIVQLFGTVEQEIASQEKINITCAYGGNLANYKSFDYELIG